MESQVRIEIPIPRGPAGPESFQTTRADHTKDPEASQPGQRLPPRAPAPGPRRRFSILPETRSGRPEPGNQGHVRPNGRAGSAPSRCPRGLVCCLYEDVGEFRRRLAAFFAAGLRAGCQVAYAGLGGEEGSRADLAGLPDLDRRLADGSVRILSLQDVYGTDHPIDGDRVVGVYAAATEQALADGFRGLRVGADASELVRSPAHLDALARYEFLADRYMAGHPLSALCGYRRSLGHDTVSELASLHATGPPGGTGFRVFGCADGAIGLGGQCEPGSVTVLRRLLPRIRDGVDDGTVVIDMADVEYVDHRLLRTLNAHAREQGVSLSLRSAPPFAARLMELLAASGRQHAEGGADT